MHASPCLLTLSFRIAGDTTSSLYRIEDVDRRRADECLALNLKKNGTSEMSRILKGTLPCVFTVASSRRFERRFFFLLQSFVSYHSWRATTSTNIGTRLGSLSGQRWQRFSGSFTRSCLSGLRGRVRGKLDASSVILDRGSGTPSQVVSNTDLSTQFPECSGMPVFRPLVET